MYSLIWKSLTFMVDIYIIHQLCKGGSKRTHVVVSVTLHSLNYTRIQFDCELLNQRLYSLQVDLHNKN